MKVLFVNLVYGTGSTGKIIADIMNLLKKYGNDVKALYGTGAFSICGREIKCFFCWLLRNFSPFTQRFFSVPAWGWYHYPRRALHAAKTLDARGSRRRICRFYAAPEFALCGLNIHTAGTHATPFLHL